MAYEAVIVKPTDRWLVGLSTDTKPSPDANLSGHMLRESDTGNEFKWTGSYWQNTMVAGAQNMHDSHVHHVPVNNFFHLHTGNITTIAWDVLAGSRVITVADDTIFAVGDELQLTAASNTYREPTYPVITAIDLVTHVLTLDRPLDLPWSILDTVEIIIENMAATAGTLFTPISYKFFPPQGTIMHVQSFVLNMTHATTGDDSLFGNMAALTNGTILRAYNGLINQYGTFTIWKTNGDIKMDMATVVYDSKAGGGLHSTTGDGRIADRTGSVPELIATNGDFLEILIQDDITAITELRLKAQGHIEGR